MTQPVITKMVVPCLIALGLAGLTTRASAQDAQTARATFVDLEGAEGGTS